MNRLQKEVNEFDKLLVVWGGRGMKAKEGLQAIVALALKENVAGILEAVGCWSVELKALLLRANESRLVQVKWREWWKELNSLEPIYYWYSWNNEE